MEKFSKREAYRTVTEMLTGMEKGSLATVDQFAFAGFGALKELLLPIDNPSVWSKDDFKYEKEVRLIHDLLQRQLGNHYKTAISSLKNSTLSSFFTPSFLIDAMTETISAAGVDIKSILEPAAGTGNFIPALKKVFSEATITAIEKDDTTFRFLKAFHPDIEALHTGYENFKNRPHDLVISNIPFGNINVFDDAMFREAIPAKIKASTRIHNYYIVKSLDNLKEGGLLAIVAPSGVMDSPGNKDIREHIVKQSNLLQAARLPNTTFSHADTFPVTDVIILQKNARKKNINAIERSFVNSEKVAVLNDRAESITVDINGYYLEKRENILGNLMAGGQYDGRSLDVTPSEDNTDASVLKDKLLDRLRIAPEEPAKKVDIHDDQILKPISTQLIPPTYPDYDLLKHGNLLIVKGKVAVVDFEGMEKIFRPQPEIQDIDRVHLFSGLRNTLNRLIDAELEGKENEMTKLRADLNAHYDLFVFRYGNLNHPANKKLALFDAEGFKILSLERREGNAYTKADLFRMQVNNAPKQTEKPATLKDAMLLSLNAHNGINLPFVSTLLDRDTTSIIREGMNDELLFRDVEAKTEERYVTKDEFLSGNIVRKIALLEEMKQHSDGGLSQHDIDNHLQKLEHVRPAFLKRELIDINIGERWIPIDIYESFAEHIFKKPTEIKYMGSSDMYLVNVKGYSNEESITHAASIHNGSIGGSRILEYAMADTQPYLQIRIEGTDPPQYKPDLDGMKNVEMKIRGVKDAFEEFLNQRKDISERIEDLYNSNINNSVRREYDGSHLQLRALEHFTPRSHQKDAIWMLLQADGGIVDHKVGAGKTLVIIASAMEMRRLGIARKPLILCMKANVAAVADDFLKAYPNAKILAPDPQKDFSPLKRQGIFASIAANDWDAVILTHDMFLAIPQSARVQRDVLSKELSNLEDDLAVLSENKSLSKRILKGLEARKQNLSARLSETEASIKRDRNILDFDKMGFDHIFVDESQEFKNLHFTTRHQQVAGLGDPSGSQRALNLEFAIRTVQEKKGGDKGVTFLSGTTISNSLVELYLLFKYLRPEKLQEQRINSFDAWAKMYARKTASYEFTVTNELKMKERYREFIKVPELARFYAEISHVVTDANLKVDKPTVENVIVNTEPTVQQERYTQQLIKFTRTKDPSHVGLTFNDNQKNALMLIATNLARKMSIDMRMIDEARYSFEVDGKLSKLCDTISKAHHESTPYKGTQLVFSDLGTPGGSGFNLYHEIKRILTERHRINPDEIQFIHDHDTKVKRDKLFRQVNTGQIRVLIGSTKKLGTGVNVQERVIAMHHLDIPWRPSDLEQRTGRGGRQGNQMAKLYTDNKVANYIYAVNRTLDSYQFNILSNKQKFISQIKNNSIDQRRIDEGAFDQEGGMNFGEYVALLSGNTDLLEKVKLEKKLSDLQRTFQVFMKRKSEAEFQIGLSERGIKSWHTSLHRIESDWKGLENTDLEKTPITISNENILDRKIAGEKLLIAIDEVKRNVTTQPVILGSMNGFVLMYDARALKAFVKGPSSQVYQSAGGEINSNPALAGRYLLDTIKRIPKVIQNTNERIAEERKKIAIYQKEVNAEFNDIKTIKSLKDQIELLDKKIEMATAITETQQVVVLDTESSYKRNPSTRQRNHKL
ncbi:MAG: hypothetical protein JNM57_10865 [Cyclobacteriaceae bacterium]|nr:hypothetical protein [Cyclobacteriaceae bacterium]